jgi:hypothetical protein
MFGRFSGVIQPMLSKFNRKAMKRTSVQTSDKTFDHLFRDKLKVIELLKLLYVEDVVQEFSICSHDRQLKQTAKDIAFDMFSLFSELYPLPFAFRQRTYGIHFKSKTKKGIRTFASYAFSSRNYKLKNSFNF